MLYGHNQTRKVLVGAVVNSRGRPATELGRRLTTEAATNFDDIGDADESLRAKPARRIIVEVSVSL